MNISFIDLFSGIGGFHQAFTAAGAACVFANDNDEKAASQYLLNYKGSGEYFFPGSISKWTSKRSGIVSGRRAAAAPPWYGPRGWKGQTGV